MIPTRYCYQSMFLNKNDKQKLAMLARALSDRFLAKMVLGLEDECTCMQCMHFAWQLDSEAISQASSRKEFPYVNKACDLPNKAWYVHASAPACAPAANLRRMDCATNSDSDSRYMGLTRSIIACSPSVATKLQTRGATCPLMLS